MIFVKIGLLKCDFCEKWYFENAIFMKNGLLKCDFYEKSDFENAIFVKYCGFKNVNFTKNAILEIWTSLNMWFWTYQF